MAVTARLLVVSKYVIVGAKKISSAILRLIYERGPWNLNPCKLEMNTSHDMSYLHETVLVRYKQSNYRNNIHFNLNMRRKGDSQTQIIKRAQSFTS